VYNQPEYLADAVFSVLGQTFADFEYIIVDDGSDDSTREILGGVDDKRVIIIRNTRNEGLTRSLNIALRYAKGKYIARLDADDLMKPNRLQMQIEVLSGQPDYALCGSNAEIIDIHGNYLHTAHTEVTSDNAFKMLLWGNFLIHSSVMFMKECIDEIGGYNEDYRFAQDYALWTGFVKRGYGVVSIPYALIKWRENFCGISAKYARGQMECADRIFLSFFRYNFPQLDRYADSDLLALRDKHGAWFRSITSPQGKEEILIEVQRRLKDERFR